VEQAVLLKQILAAGDGDRRGAGRQLVDLRPDETHEALQGHPLPDSGGLAFEWDCIHVDRLPLLRKKQGRL
jgi:hypothetical protein